MASAAITAGTSLLSGIAGGKGAKKAAKVQAAAYQKGIDETARQFNVTQQNLAPYLAAGGQGLNGFLTLLGLNGNNQQGSAINALMQSPQYTSAYDNGVDTILANAAATGGLRGGNTQNSLASFGGNLLSSLIQNQLGNYGSLINVGSGTGSTLGQLGQNNSQQISQLLAQKGNAQATATAAPYAAFASTLNGLNQSFGQGSGFSW